MYIASEKTAFSERLKQTLNRHGWPYTSPTWLAREFNIRYSGASVSVQTANNWLTAAAIPSQDKLQVLAAWLGVSSQWLRFGEESSLHQVETTTPIYQNIQLNLADLPDKITKLTPKQKQLVYDLVKALIENNP